MNVVAHNMLASNAARQYNINVKGKRKNTEKLSSGYKINRAADDAAGLSISEKMRNQIRNLNQSMKNIEDGISLMNVADGALNESHSILHRIEELAVQSANDTNSQEDRDAINDEVKELKEELSRIFKTTHFNGKKLWTTSYSPNITGVPNDIQMYHDESHPSDYGGVLINEKRYSWAEIGVDFEDDGVTFKEGKYMIKDKDNPDEIIELVTKQGNVPPEISRRYSWKADDSAIYVNGLKAATYDELGVEAPSEIDRTYSFDFHGMNISFDVPAGDKIKDIAEGINGGNFASEVTWDSVVDGNRRPSNYVIEDIKNAKISDSWRDRIDTSDNSYTEFFSLEANEDGITLKDVTGHTYSSKTWADLGIKDWGTQSEVSDLNPVEKDKVYTFSDTETGFSIDFTISEVAGKGNIIDELNGLSFRSGLNVPTKTSVYVPTYSGSNFTKLSVGVAYTGISYNLADATGNSFDHTSPLNTSYEVRDYGSTLTFTNVLKDNSGNQLDVAKGSFNYASVLSAINDLSVHDSFIGNDFVRFLIRGGEYSINLSGTNGFSTSMQIKNTGFGMFYGNTEAELDSYKARLKDFALDAKIVLSTLKPSSQMQQPEMILRASRNGSSTSDPFGGTKLNPPVKEVYIQSGANSGEHHKLEWNSLSLASLGLGGVSVDTREGAEASINAVQRAVKVLSAERSNFGAQTNRLTATLNGNELYAENLQKAESQIRDTDYAEELGEFHKHNILEQAGQAMIAQANQSQQGLLQLLQS